MHAHVHTCNSWQLLPGSSVHGIFQAKILKWFAISFFRGYSWIRDRIWVSCIGRRILYLCTTWEGLLGKPVVRMSGTTKWCQEFQAWDLEGVGTDLEHPKNQSDGLLSIDWDVSLQNSLCWKQNLNSDTTSIHWELTQRDKFCKTMHLFYHKVKLIQKNPQSSALFNIFLCF